MEVKDMKETRGIGGEEVNERNESDGKEGNK